MASRQYVWCDGEGKLLMHRVLFQPEGSPAEGWYPRSYQGKEKAGREARPEKQSERAGYCTVLDQAEVSLDSKPSENKPPRVAISKSVSRRL